MPDMIKNSDGLVAMQHYNPNGCSVIVEDTNKKTTYTFVPKFNVSMAWVYPEHVERLLKQRAKMCCNKQQQKFYLASQINVNLHETGDRHGVKRNG